MRRRQIQRKCAQGVIQCCIVELEWREFTESANLLRLCFAEGRGALESGAIVGRSPRQRDWRGEGTIGYGLDNTGMGSQ